MKRLRQTATIVKPNELADYINGGVVADARFDYLNLEFLICLDFRA
jgi:hypothetical protein